MMVTKNASRKAPAVTIRFRSKVELAKVKRAARLEGLSLNTFVIGRASNGADEVIAKNQNMTIQEYSVASIEKAIARG